LVDNYVDVDGVYWHVYTCGNPAWDTCVFGTGMPQSCRTDAKFLGRLCEKFNVFAFDLPGQGLSQQYDLSVFNYTYGAITEKIRKLLNIIKPPTPWFVFRSEVISYVLDPILDEMEDNITILAGVDPDALNGCDNASAAIGVCSQMTVLPPSYWTYFNTLVLQGYSNSCLFAQQFFFGPPPNYGLTSETVAALSPDFLGLVGPSIRGLGLYSNCTNYTLYVEIDTNVVVPNATVFNNVSYDLVQYLFAAEPRWSFPQLIFIHDGIREPSFYLQNMNMMQQLLNNYPRMYMVGVGSSAHAMQTDAWNNLFDAYKLALEYLDIELKSDAD